MGFARNEDGDEVSDLLERAAAGDEAGWRALLTRHHDRLRRMVALRLDPRLQGRVDPSDVLQDAYLDAAAQLPNYLRQQELPFFLWLRSLAGTRLAKAHRHHLDAQIRDVRREVSLYRGALPAASSAALASRLLGRECPPSEAAIRAELQVRLQDALNRMDPLDREVLTLRHFERLTTVETARVLAISEAAAGKRYLRALGRLKEILVQAPGGLGGIEQ
jgi:RNA polymerase sigma-70 factor (ECF subfamily)